MKKHFSGLLISIMVFSITTESVTYYKHINKNKSVEAEWNQSVKQKFVDEMTKNKLEQANTYAASCCHCLQLRKYETLEVQSKKLKLGMTQQEVEQILGKPDYVDGLKNYCYCTDQTSFSISVPLVVEFDNNYKVKKVSFISFGE